VTLLGRWHKADGSGGFALFETINPGAIFEWAAAWADVLEVSVVPVLEDADAGAIMAKVFKK
jgi:hypothetical protein